MSTPLTNYTPATDFSAYQTLYPTSPLNGANLDAELAAIATSIAGLNERATGFVRPATSTPYWQRVANDPRLFELARGAGAFSWTTRGATLDGPYDYRRGVFQGEHPLAGSAPNPTMVNYGRGAQPTYVRFEMRSGPAPTANGVSSGVYDQWYDATLGDNVTYTAPANVTCTNVRLGSGPTSPAPTASATTYIYRASLWLPPTWSGVHVSRAAPVGGGGITLLQMPNMKTDNLVEPTSLTRIRATRHSSSDFLNMQYCVMRADGTIDDSEIRIDFGPMSEWVNRWLTFELVTQWSTTETADGYFSLNGVKLAEWTNRRTYPAGTPTLNRFVYGISVGGAGGLTASDFYVPDDRETYVLFTDVAYGAVAP